VIVGLLALLSWITVIQRVAHVFQVAAPADNGSAPPSAGPAVKGK